MKTFNKSIISLALLFAAAGSVTAATSGDGHKTIRADFKNKLLLIPCVEVSNTPFDGFYNVLMSISGDGSGVEWKVTEEKLAAEGECDSAPDTSSTDDLLKSMGMPSTAELIKNGGKEDDTNDDKNDSGQGTSNTSSSITNTVNNAIDTAINGATK